MLAKHEIPRLLHKLMTGKIHPDEPLFCLRARDGTAADMVREWATRNDGAAGQDKVPEARELAAKMDAWPQKQVAGKKETRTGELPDKPRVWRRPAYDDLMLAVFQLKVTCWTQDLLDNYPDHYVFAAEKDNFRNPGLTLRIIALGDHRMQECEVQELAAQVEQEFSLPVNVFYCYGYDYVSGPLEALHCD